jgi:hypothetical protein
MKTFLKSEAFLPVDILYCTDGDKEYEACAQFERRATVFVTRNPRASNVEHGDEISLLAAED